jgi:putative phosphoesterase
VELLRGADVILHAGDVSTVAVLEELRALGPPVHAVCGNVDEAALRELLPSELVIDAGGVQIGMTHDAGPQAGREERLARRFPAAAAVVYGHTHRPQVERHGTLWILNPGSPTERRRAPEHTMLLLEVEAGEIRPELVTLSP